MSSINNVERFRKRLEENKICVGTSVQLCDPLVSEVAAATRRRRIGGGTPPPR